MRFPLPPFGPYLRRDNNGSIARCIHVSQSIDRMWFLSLKFISVYSNATLFATRLVLMESIFLTSLSSIIYVNETPDSSHT